LLSTYEEINCSNSKVWYRRIWRTDSQLHLGHGHLPFILS